MSDNELRELERAVLAEPHNADARQKLARARERAGLWRVPLRPYQEEAVKAFLAYVESGGRRGIIHLPVGTGKTVVGLYLAFCSGRVLWLAHREELVQQPLDRLTDAWPQCSKGLVRGGTNQVGSEDVIVASIASLAVKPDLEKDPTAKDRLERILEHGPINLVIVDEVHHASEGSAYEEILTRLPGVPALGLTATVERGDGKGLDTVWDRVVYGLQVPEAIAMGALAPPKLPFIVSPIDTLEAPEEVRTERELHQIMERRFQADGAVTHVANETARLMVELLSDRKRALCFTVLVRQAEETADALNRLGWPAACVSGETPRKERAEIQEKFKRGELRALCNANALTEGTDLPPTDAVVLARPFISKTLFVQALGRATRLAPGKLDWAVLDLSDCTKLHDFMAAAPVLVGEEKIEGDARDVASGGAGEFKIKASGTPPPNVNWLEFKYGWVAGAGKTLAVAIRKAIAPDKTGTDAEVYELWTESNRVWEPVAGAVYHDADLAQGVGRDLVRRLGGARARRYSGDDNEWRAGAPTEAQEKSLEKWRIYREKSPEAYATRGGASDALQVRMTRAAFDKLKLGANPVQPNWTPPAPKQKPLPLPETVAAAAPAVALAPNHGHVFPSEGATQRELMTCSRCGVEDGKLASVCPTASPVARPEPVRRAQRRRPQAVQFDAGATKNVLVEHQRDCDSCVAGVFCDYADYLKNLVDPTPEAVDHEAVASDLAAAVGLEPGDAHPFAPPANTPVAPSSLLDDPLF